MSLQRSAVVHTSIVAPPRDLVAWMTDMTAWKTWAPWIRSVAITAPGAWTLGTEAGRLEVQFVEPNTFGVLDHHVALASGVTAFNAMRVVANGAGSELVMLIFQSPGVSDAEFERDIHAVTDDLARLKAVAESMRWE